MKDIWYKEGLFWRHTESWGLGKGDLVTNTCKKIIRDNDRSPWAYDSLYACQQLLLDERRWPISMDEDMDSKNRLEWIRYRWPGKVKRWIIKKTGWKFIKDKGWKYRWVTGMTRDPFTALYTACVEMGKPELIPDTPPKWYNYKPSFWAWWKYLCTKEDKYLKRYRFWDRFSTSKKPYVLRLRETREIAIQGI